MARAPSTAGLLKSRGGALIPKPATPPGKPGVHDPEPQAGLVRSGGGQMRPPKPATPPGKPGVHDPEPQPGLVKPKPPGTFKPRFGRKIKTGLKTYGNQVGIR